MSASAGVSPGVPRRPGCRAGGAISGHKWGRRRDGAAPTLSPAGAQGQLDSTRGWGSGFIETSRPHGPPPDRRAVIRADREG